MLLMVVRSLFVKIGPTNGHLLFTIMRKLLVILVCIATGLAVANPAWAHGGGGGGGSGGAGAAGGGPPVAVTVEAEATAVARVTGLE